MSNKYNIEENINIIINELNNNSELIIKRFLIGIKNPIDVAIIYINGLVNSDLINRDILNPLMIEIREDLSEILYLSDYLCKKYICISDAQIEEDVRKVVNQIKNGKTVLIINQCKDYILMDTKGGMYRQISDAQNESSIRGPRESFIENFEVNISLIKRRIKDKNLIIEKTVVGKRTKSNIAIIYIKDITDSNIVEYIKERIATIDIDSISASGTLGQLIENHTYSIFPQFYITERVDVIQSNILEGKIAIILEGATQVISLPSLFIDFFQAVEDYYERFIVASFSRIIRLVCAFIVITLPSLYLNAIKYNLEIIPVNFVVPILRSRIGISLSPFFEIILMELVVEVLREGGLRLPNKIGQTLSVVGGIIIGQMAVEAKVVSPDTLLIVGIGAVCTFVIPNYEMTISIRLLRFPMLIICNLFGLLGIVLFWYVIMVHLLSFDSFGIPYISMNPSDMKDIFIRAPVQYLNKRPKDIAAKDKIRQKTSKE
ncbi:spore germination protein [Clostridium cochlearium]|uniref:spore germination protein n=1 Tax=Clostridium cochlearium TaxID=1494 RepID=UPI00241BF2A4|nr:spore germination protein [Clostridium cochlearium]MBE6066004.1 spore germination protein [Clostridium cochlearium]